MYQHKKNFNDVTKTEIYQEFEVQLMQKFSSLKKDDLKYLRTKIDQDSHKIPYPIAQKMGILLDQQ
jgi:hypothetical protein